MKRIQFCVERCVFRQEILSLSHSIAKKQIRPFGHFAGCTCISPSTLTISPTFKGGLRSRPLGHMRFLLELALHPCNCVWVTFSFTWAKCRKAEKIRVGFLPGCAGSRQLQTSWNYYTIQRRIEVPTRCCLNFCSSSPGSILSEGRDVFATPCTVCTVWEYYVRN